MKKTNLFFSFLFFSLMPFLSIGQTAGDITCGNQDPPENLQLTTGVSDLTYLIDSGCDPLKIGIRFVLLTRDDGFGNFDINDPMLQEWADDMNDAWNNINDPFDCEPSLDYNRSANFQVDLKGVDTIANTEAWDYQKAAWAYGDVYSSGSFCPDSIIYNDVWPALKEVVEGYNIQYPNTINYFFVENGQHLNYLEEFVNNGDVDIEPWSHFGNTQIFSGCSRFPSFNYYNDKDIFIVMADRFEAFYWRFYYGHTYSPEDADHTQYEMSMWHLNPIEHLLNHELGHSIMSTSHKSCPCRSLMAFTCHDWKNHIAKANLERLHQTLSTTSNNDYIMCDDLTDSHCDILVEEDVLLNKPISVYGDLIITSGNTLTVTSEVYLSDYSRIEVEKNAKLIVDGGTLTSLCNAWEGIKVYGGNSDFDVRFENGALIENTQKAAVSMFAPVPWPDITNYGNGILQAEYTTFNNTKRMVEFMSWSPLPNPSYVAHCVQNGGKWGITNWNCLGIDVKDNVFNDISDHGIVISKGYMRIRGNEFNSGKNDILHNNVTAGISSEIYENLFMGERIGYHARGATASTTEIYDNKFETEEWSVIHDGHNQFNLYRNEILSPFGISSIDNGDGSASVYYNDFNHNILGTYVSGVNKDYNFFENCFNSSWLDNYINGEVSPVIHSNLAAANNCFTHSGSVSSTTQDIGGSPVSFTYLEPNDFIVDCRDAVLAHPNVNRVHVEEYDELQGCYSNVIAEDSLSGPCWPDRLDRNAVMDAITWINNTLVEIDTDESLTDQQKQQLNHIYSSCLSRVKSYLFELNLKEERYVDARSVYATDHDDDAKVYIYSTYILENALDSAQIYLEAIIPQSEKMEDFIKLQKINLHRLPQGPFYVADSTELDIVYVISQKDHPYSGYGKALYYELTGKVLSSDLPRRDGAESRSLLTESEKEQEVVFYPNPFNEILNIQIKGYENVKIEIIDFFGREVYTQESKASFIDIATDTWQEGMYLIKVEHAGEIVHTGKYILIK